MIASAGLSDVGKKREINEDYFVLNHENQLFLLADGMGGHTAGEVASELGVRTIESFVMLANDTHELTWPFGYNVRLSYEQNVLKTALQLANLKVGHAADEKPEYAGMGSTVVALWIRGDLAIFSHIGDSRLYLLREAQLQQLTEDHTLIQEQLARGMITAQEAREHRLRHVVTQALGQNQRIEVDAYELQFEPGDRLLLCSDGLTDKLEDGAIAEVMGGADSPETACRLLVDAANAAGGDDNITVVCVWRS